MRSLLRLGMSLLLGLLVGCGGGGGGGGSSAPIPYDLNALVSVYSQQSHSYTLSASNGGNSYTLRLSHVPGPSATFGTTTANTVVLSVDVYENGTLIASDATTRYFLLNPFQLLGDYDATTGYATVYASQQALPTAAMVGDSGAFDTGTIYYDTSFTTVFGTLTDTWTLDAGPTFCADTAESTATGGDTESDCYTFDAGGAVTGLTITLLVNGVTLTFS